MKNFGSVFKEQSKSPVSDLEIAVFEQQLKTELPLDYKEYLKFYDGVQPIHEVFLISKEEGASLLHYFFGLKETKYESLQENLNTFLELQEYPEYAKTSEFLAIGRDQGGNLLALNIADHKDHHVYFVEVHGLENPIFRVASTFTEFLENLYTLSYKSEIERIMKIGTLEELKAYIGEDVDILFNKDQYNRDLLLYSVICIREDFVEYLLPFYGKEQIEASQETALSNSILFEGYEGIISKLNIALRE
ncbi:SMI1/KNR4 family protein [Acinetobacter sichuanensis]|uniref:SMI1/KNR4 family protein n=1 Tax=Acinetobacter sichuanensis TaxID=2136183 RepID=A0A371YTB7_9GAMM|nr:SMI1/KNR4 family protein [Acinetobacter sichuanensis]RFC84720.1 SMI1/KNR4 family protein [Acinetobacter sichuanensis]